MIRVCRTIAWEIEGGKAGSVFTEFVPPEVAVGLILRDPVFVHIGEEIELAEGGEEGADARPFVRRDGRARRGPGCSVGRGERVELAAERDVNSAP